MTYRALLFSFDGRIPRSKYWIGIALSLAYVLLTLAICLGIIELFPDVSTSALWVYFAFLLPILWVFIALPVKRLHDRNKTGWYYVLYFTIPNFLERLADRQEEGSFAWWILIILTLGISAWAIIELGFLKGTDGENKYGPDPFAQDPKKLEDVFD